MTVKTFVRKGGVPAVPDLSSTDLIRKTRLMANATVILVRVEAFQDGVLRATHLKLTTPDATKTFTDLHAALKAYKVAIRRPVETARLRNAA